MGTVLREMFNGDDYQPDRDDKRLTGQILRVYDCMKDGKPRALNAISAITGDPEASVSAQLRHLRKARFGGHELKKEYQGNGLYLYQLVVNTDKKQLRLI